MSSYVRHIVLGSVVIGLGLVALTQPAWSLQQQDGPNRDPASIHSNLEGEFRVFDPVNIHGPYPEAPYVAHPGDVLCLQLSYPISPPFPTKVVAHSNNAAATPMGELAVRSPGRIVTLAAGKKEEGVVGVGYLTVLGRASKPGMATITCEVSLGEGKTLEVPLKIKVEAAEE